MKLQPSEIETLSIKEVEYFIERLNQDNEEYNKEMEKMKSKRK